MPTFECTQCTWKGEKLYMPGNSCPNCSYEFQVCNHPGLVPHTVIAGKQTWDKNQSFIDWSSNIINAHYLRVVKYYCPGCNQLIDAPKEATDAKE